MNGKAETMAGLPTDYLAKNEKRPSRWPYFALLFHKRHAGICMLSTGPFVSPNVRDLSAFQFTNVHLASN